METDNRYNATLTFKAEDVEKPDAPADFEAGLVWRDLPYGGLVPLEREIVNLISTTVSWGEAVVEAKK